MTHMLAFDLESTFREIIARMETQGIFDREAYSDLVEEVLEEKREVGELDDDNNIEEYIEKLKMRWPEAEESLLSVQSGDILEQE